MSIGKNRTVGPRTQTRTDEFLRLLIQEVQIQTDAGAGDTAAILAALGNLSTEITAEQINLNTDTLESSNDAIQAATELIRDRTTPKNKLYRLENEAEDTVTDITFLDEGDPANRRESTIVLSSVALGISATKTLEYGGSAGDYYVNKITVS